ncbi:MAG: CapA family protein [Clostridia bacterium]|nr:CapA family protein [Clostridia bacterium]
MGNLKDKYSIIAAVMCLTFVCAAVCILVTFWGAPRMSATDSTAALPYADEDASSSDESGDSLATVMIAGDFLVHKSVYSQAQTDVHAYDFTPYFSEVDDIFTADLNILALKTPVDARGGNKKIDTSPTFNAPIETLDAVSALGFDVCITAGNHSFDKGTKGLKATLENLHSHGLDTVGTYASQAEHDKPYIAQIGGINVGVAAYVVNPEASEVSSRGEYSINFISGDLDCADDILSDVDAMRAAGAEFIIVSMHWGNEFASSPTDTQRQLAQTLCEGGVDVIYGTHTQSVQPVELLTVTRADSSERRCLVAYSLGNFFCNSKKHPELSANGIALGLGIARDDSGAACLSDAFCLPLYLHTSGRDGSDAFRLLPSGEFASADSRPEIFSSDEQWQSCIDAWNHACSAAGSDITSVCGSEDMPAWMR